MSAVGEIEKPEIKKTIEGVVSETPVADDLRSMSVPRRNSQNFRLLILPAITGAALVYHVLVSKDENPIDTRSYSIFLGGIIALSLIGFLFQLKVKTGREWMRENYPIFSAAVIVLALLEMLTTHFRVLEMPYFPSPAAILQNMINDRKELFQCTKASLFLLVGGYSVGVACGLVTGVIVGWFKAARYWGMPVLKLVGPIPATAWIPLAMTVSTNAKMSAIGLIAIAVWFPVTMLTMSGIANTRSSLLDVARTFGASPSYLIFRVAIPAAMPSIFLGLFMGLGASFLTLMVAEQVGVDSGLGWYLQWAQGWAEYGKVLAALVIVAVFFSTIMTLLFKVRDRVLVWQKGTIKW